MTPNIGVNVSALTVALAPDAYLMEIEALAAEAEQVCAKKIRMDTK